MDWYERAQEEIEREYDSGNITHSEMIEQEKELEREAEESNYFQ